MATVRILVTGATGRVGGALVPVLKRAGASVVALARDPARAAALKTQGVELRQADLADPASLPRALAGIDKAFLATAETPDQAVLEKNFIAAAATAGIGHIVKLSAQSAGMAPPRSFGKFHREAEVALEQSGVPFTVLRPHFFMQSIMIFATEIRQKNRFTAPLKTGRVSMVDLRDVAAVAACCLADDSQKGKAYILTGPRPVDFYEVAKLVSQARGRNVEFRHVPAFIARMTMPRITGLPRWYTDLTIDLFVALNRGAQTPMTDS
ncbi:MAG: NmrA family NAD(P)-binding protein, partial [Candidatus Eiseniibacteriota bacterium]